MKKFLLLFVILLTSCITVKEIALVSEFDKEEAKLLLMDGTNSIIGSAFLRQNGGGIVTCAGATVNLIPATKYAEERMNALYGSSGKVLYLNILEASYSRVNLKPDIGLYRTLQRKTICNASGEFELKNVADGEFFLQTEVIWKVGNSTQGGFLAKKISVSNGEVLEVVLTLSR